MLRRKSAGSISDFVPSTVHPIASATRAAKHRPLRIAPNRLRNWRVSADGLRLSLFTLTVFNISAIQVYLGPLRYARPALSLLALSCAIALLNPRALRWRNLVEAWPSRAVALLFLLSLFSAAFGLSTGGSLRYIKEVYLGLLVIFFLSVAAIRTTRDLAFLMWGYLTGIFFLLLLTITVFRLEPTARGLDRIEGGLTQFDANDLGMLFLMAIPTGILMFYNSGLLGKVLSGVVVVGSAAAIALTGSRGAMVGMAIVGVVLFASLSRIGIGKRVAFLCVLVGALALAAPAGYWDQMSTILSPSKDYNMSDEYGRIEIAKRGVGYMLRYPVFGVGIANFGRAEGQISPIARRAALEGQGARWIAPHNTYVQVGAELGVIGLGTWLTLIFGGTVGLWRLRRTIPRSWDRGTASQRFLREACLFLPMSLLAFAVTSYFLTHAFTGPPYIFFVFLSGVSVLVQREKLADSRDAVAEQVMRHTPAT